MADFVTIRVPNGESFTDLHSRVVIQNNNTHSKPVLLGNQKLLCHISALPLKMLLKIK
jgi:alpha-ribazole phosphatase